MATSVKKLSNLIARNLLVGMSRSLYARRVMTRSRCSTSLVDQMEDGHETNDKDFSRWRNGGGVFHRTACIDPTAYIEFGAIVHSKVVLSGYVQVGSGAIIGPAVTVGHSTKIGYNVALTNCSVGDSCVIHNGVCIGQDGFGFFVDDDGNMVKKPQVELFVEVSLIDVQNLDSNAVSLDWSQTKSGHSFVIERILHLLHARIGDHVEIGANTCIDRGSWRDTVIGDYTKIDNLVQIGHNVVIGKSCMICGQVGVAGSATLGDYVVLGGRVAVRDHASIISKVRLAANSCVTRDIEKPGDYGGFPAVPIHEWRRQVANLRRISKKMTQ